jgi:Arc/MetJ-type ribon-helix-helix transcriptional regulator
MQDDAIHTGQIVYEEPGSTANGIAPRSASSDDQGQTGPRLDNIASSVREVAQKTGEVINKATESIGKAIESALSARDHVVMVRVNDESLKRLDALVQSGIFKSRSEAAAFLISEGIQAQRALFERIAEKISEIERLRSELKSIVNTEES